MRLMAPMRPAAICSRARLTAGRKRLHSASIAKTPRALAACAIAATSALASAIGFSIRTGLPAAIALNACAAWRWLGVAI